MFLWQSLIREFLCGDAVCGFTMGDWRYAGERKVTTQGKIRIPERLFEFDILHPDQGAHWAYEKTQGFLLVSNLPLQKPQYRNVGLEDIGDEGQGYRTNIPKMFFADYEGRGKGPEKSPLPEKARVETGEKRFFAFRDAMAEGERRSCYVFTWTQFDNTIGDNEWADPLSDIPRFS